MKAMENNCFAPPALTGTEQGRCASASPPPTLQAPAPLRVRSEPGGPRTPQTTSSIARERLDDTVDDSVSHTTQSDIDDDMEVTLEECHEIDDNNSWSPTGMLNTSPNFVVGEASTNKTENSANAVQSDHSSSHNAQGGSSSEATVDLGSHHDDAEGKEEVDFEVALRRSRLHHSLEMMTERATAAELGVHARELSAEQEALDAVESATPRPGAGASSRIETSTTTGTRARGLSAGKCGNSFDSGSVARSFSSAEREDLLSQVRGLKNQVAFQARALVEREGELERQQGVIDAVNDKLQRETARLREVQERLRVAEKLHETTKKELAVARSQLTAPPLIPSQNTGEGAGSTQGGSDRMKLAAARREIARLRKALSLGVVHGRIQESESNPSLKGFQAPVVMVPSQGRSVANGEKEKIESSITGNKSAPENVVSSKLLQALEEENKVLQRQRNELIACVQKQSKLIEIMRRQQLHLNAARLLQLSDETFASAVRRASDI